MGTNKSLSMALTVACRAILLLLLAHPAPVSGAVLGRYLNCMFPLMIPDPGTKQQQQQVYSTTTILLRGPPVSLSINPCFSSSSGRALLRARAAGEQHDPQCATGKSPRCTAAAATAAAAVAAAGETTSVSSWMSECVYFQSCRDA